MTEAQQEQELDSRKKGRLQCGARSSRTGGQARQENLGLSRTGALAHRARASTSGNHTHRGDQHLTVGLPLVLHDYEQAIGKCVVQHIVVDREGVAAEFLAQLQQEGRQMGTLLRADQYESECSFEQVGPRQPWRYNRDGQLICEVASACFTLLAKPDRGESGLPLTRADWYAV